MARRSPASRLKPARTVTCSALDFEVDLEQGRRGGAHGASTPAMRARVRGAPQVGEYREGERGDDEQEGEGERAGQAELLEGDEDLVRQPAWVVGDDDDGPEGTHGPRPGGRKARRQPWGGEGERDASEGLQGAVAEQGGVLLDAGVDRGEGGMGAQHVERRRLVELGDDESEEGVHPRQVDVGEKVPERAFRTDEEDEQKADDERRHHQREHDA